jgi:dCMP deaminase
MVINAGIKRIVYEEGYGDQLASEMIAEAGIVLDRFERHKDGEV